MKEYEVIIEKIDTIHTNLTELKDDFKIMNGSVAKNTKFRHVMKGAGVAVSVFLGSGLIWKIIN